MAKEKEAAAGLKLYDGEPYEIMRSEPEQLREVFEANLKGGDVDEFDFDRVKVPTGGGTVWSVPDIHGEPLSVEELVGIVIDHDDRRGYWSVGFEESGGGTPPDCSSHDCRTGRGFIRGDETEDAEGQPLPPVVRECDECPMSQWGSLDPKDKEDNRQACAKRKLLFLVRPDDSLPIIVDCAPTSVRHLRKFLLRLSGRAIPCYSAIWGLSLAVDKARKGQKYSVVVPRVIHKLKPEQVERTRAFQKLFRPLFERVGVDGAPSAEASS